MELSYWMDSATSPGYPPLTGDISADVVVVGAGITGICTAWELARTGHRVVVAEAREIVSGTTGNTTAKVTSLHTMIYGTLRDSLGPPAAHQYADAQQDAIERIRHTVAELGIDCDLETRAAYTYGTDPESTERLMAEASAARDAGLPAYFVTTTPLPFPVAGAVRVDDQAQFHPRKFLFALAGEIVRNGGVIAEHSRVVDVETAGDGVRVRIEGGVTVTAHHAVLATGFPVVSKLSLMTRLAPRTELVVAAPIGADRDPDGMYLTGEEHVRSARTAPYRDGQRLLLVTGEAARTGSGHDNQRFERLVEWGRTHFGIEQVAYGWAAQDLTTTDGVPYVGAMPGQRGVWVGTGFGGWGMTNGVAAGRLLAALITEKDVPAWADLFDPHRLHPVVEAGRLISGAASVAQHYVGDRLAASIPLEQIPPGHGAVVRISGGRYAVYRDDAGGLTATSAACTHMGCIVAFNEVERCWECPCHGSRFDVDGEVLRGPATHPLAAADLPGVTRQDPPGGH